MDTHSFTASVSSASTATTHRGIRLHVKKQLAQDIESNGGIQHFAGQNNRNLYHLLQRKADGDPDDHPYGKRGDTIRKQLRQQVYRWIAKDKTGQYVSEILNPWQIVQFSARMPETRTRPKPRRQNSNGSLSSADTSSDSDTIPGRIARCPPPTGANSKTPPSQVVADNRRAHSTTPLTPLVRQIGRMSVNGDTLKRKIGNFDLETVASKACKSIGGLRSECLNASLTQFRL
jgi:hypothetical protein